MIIMGQAGAIGGAGRFLLMLPLCLSVAIVYRATRIDELRALPKAVLTLWLTILLGMYAVGVGLWALFSIMA